MLFRQLISQMLDGDRLRRCLRCHHCHGPLLLILTLRRLSLLFADRVAHATTWRTIERPRNSFRVGPRGACPYFIPPITYAPTHPLLNLARCGPICGPERKNRSTGGG